MTTVDPQKAFYRLKRMALQFIPEKDFEKIEKTSVVLHFQKGETILKQGGSPTHVAYLESGLVKFSYENEWQKNLILTIVSAPKILGGANLFYKDNNLFSIIAVEPCEVMLIDTKVLLTVLSDNARFAIMLFQYASEMFKTSILNFISLAYKQKEARIADIVLYLAEHVFHANSFRLSLTRKELGEFAGCSTENIIMTLRRWQSEDIIRFENKDLTIKDPGKLKYISKIG
ncbi:MAG: Crp/Fnr family transcriptional regulator [Bacteroidota bacterium]